MADDPYGAYRAHFDALIARISEVQNDFVSLWVEAMRNDPDRRGLMVTYAAGGLITEIKLDESVPHMTFGIRDCF